MTIRSSADTIRAHIDRLKGYEAVVEHDNFTAPAMTELKANAKAVISDIESELASMEDVVDNWS